MPSQRLTKKRLQRLQAGLCLLGCNSHNLVPDGKFGDETIEALKAYQRRMKRRHKAEQYRVTGELDGVTMHLLSATEFQLPKGKSTLKQKQCILILLGFTDGGALIADGEDGDHTANAMVQFALAHLKDGKTRM